jgi:hypothetical protein
LVSATSTRPNSKSLKGQREPKKSFGAEKFTEAANSSDWVPGLTKFVKEFPGSPLALVAFPRLLAVAKQEKLTEQQAEDLIKEFHTSALRWGERMDIQVDIEAGASLAQQQYLPELAKKLLEKAQPRLTPESPDSWRVALARGLIALGKSPEGIAILQPLHEKNPLEPGISFALATGLEAEGDWKTARELYAELAVLPQLEMVVRSAVNPSDGLPSERVARLWRKDHESTEELDAYLMEVYKRRLTSFAQPRSDAETPRTGNRVALLELFTGAACPPCVAADVASEGLHVTFPRDEVIVIRYHEHVPGPDPLANLDTQGRAQFYGIAGTPMAFLNGSGLDDLRGGASVGGFLNHAESVYTALRERISPILAQQTDIKLELTAQADNGSLVLTAEATGPEQFDPDLRLRLALVEDDIHFVAPNGIRLHDAVVRSMPGSPEGIFPKDGKLNFRKTIVLADLKQRLSQQIAKAEEDYRVEFPVKPLALKNLQLVGFVQNDKTREILQAAIVPVSGTISVSKTAPEPDAASAAPAQDGADKPAE